MSARPHIDPPAPRQKLERPCGCVLEVRVPGDGRLIPCFERGASTYCATHPLGVGAWAEVIGRGMVALVVVPGVRREAPVAPVVKPAVVVVMPTAMPVRREVPSLFGVVR